MKRTILDNLPTIWVVAVFLFGLALVANHAEAGHSRNNGTCADDKIHYQNMYQKRTDAPLWNESVAMRDKANSMNNTEKCEEYYEEALRMIRKPYPTE